MSAPQARTWLDALLQHVQAKPCVILRLDEGDSSQLFASRRGLNEFTLARTHGLFADIKTPTICLVFGKLLEWAYPNEAEHIAYIGLVSSRNPITTLETRTQMIEEDVERMERGTRDAATGIDPWATDVEQTTRIDRAESDIKRIEELYLQSHKECPP